MLKHVFIIFLLSGMALLVINRWVDQPLRWDTNSDDILYAVTMLMLLSYLLAGPLSRMTGEEARRTALHAVAWIGIFMVIAVGYSYRFELAGVRDRVLGTLIPGREIRSAPGMTRFQISSNGHFYIRARVNGTPVRFLVDTGATDIVFSPGDAERVGWALDELNYNRIYQTANGIGEGASVVVDEFRLGDLRLEEVRASVNRAPMSESLLGMAFFNRLRGYRVEEGTLTIYW